MAVADILDWTGPVHHAADVTPDAVSRIYAGLVNRTLPQAEWTHEAHLVAATVLLRAEGLAGAEAQMPGMIQRYNVAVGGSNTDSGGYHHTITLFYLRAIHHVLREGGLLSPIRVDDVTACRAVLDAALADRDAPLAHYSAELLFSVAARRAWMEPDLAPLPD